jgi:cob(I)alamin adenosyltransferase
MWIGQEQSCDFSSCFFLSVLMPYGAKGHAEKRERSASMKIYTKKGDAGETGLIGGARVAKDHLRVQACGELDELNAILGLVQANAAFGLPLPAGLDAELRSLQADLFLLGAELATPRGGSLGLRGINATSTEVLEQAIDRMEASLPPLKSFILPGGSVAGAQLHLARTVCRRVERRIAVLHRAEPLRSDVLQYVNRFSDYLFVAARYVNQALGIVESPWIPRE